MIDFLISLPTWPGSLVAMGFTAVTGFVVYLVSYKLISKYKREDMKEPTNNLFRVVGMLFSLMLALAFSEVIAEQRTIRNAVQRETVAISDIFEVLKMYDIEKTREIRTILIDYVQAVIDDDWPALAEDRLSPRVGALKTQLAEGVLNLKPATSNQEKMLSHIQADIDALSDYRVVRLDSALATPPVFVYVIIFGFLVTMACFGAYGPQAPLVVLAFLYTVFVGLVLYLVLAMSDPFQGNFGVAPAPFEYLVETLQSEIR
jgi:ABC-type multidrug transport system fused ATPase/permease subunit